MKALVAVSLSLSLAVGFYTGLTLEGNTQALSISRLTGASYSQVLDLSHRHNVMDLLEDH